jgi:aromatic-L-amino-acid decarboxylase
MTELGGSLEDRSLELDAAAMRDLAEAALERVIAHIESLPRQPAWVDTAPAVAAAKALVEPLPTAATPLAELLDEIFERHAPASFTTAGPGYLAYIPGGGLFQSAVADLIADGINRYTGVFAAAPGLVQLEMNTVRWFCEIVGYPLGAGGILTSGGSLANLSAVVAARVAKLGEAFLDGTIYVSDQVHHCVDKAARIAGFPRANLRTLAADDRFRLDPAAVERAIVHDRDRGLRPFLLVASAGTTNTGAIDPLPELAALARRHDLWLHVDAAYGGFFALTARGRAALAGIEEADSVVLDPHKGLFLPYGTGALLVRDAAVLKAAHSEFAEYMPALQSDPDLIDPCEVSPELSKPFRGLRIWLPLKLHGVEPFRRNLDEKLDLARWITNELRALEALEILAEPQLSTVAFALRAPALPLAEANRRTRALLDAVNGRRRVHLTGTQLGGRFAIRISILSFRTHRDRLEACLADIESALAEQLEATGQR